MKKTVIALAAAAMTAPLAANAETSWFGFSQITASMADSETNDGLAFGGDRVRIGYKASEGDAFAKLQVDFNRNEASHNKTGQLPGFIKDAVVGYKLGGGNKISLGQFKTPVGMDFNTSGKKLDITKRGMEKGLVLERSAGAMVSGDLAGGLGYDIGLFNPATRTGAVNTQPGVDGNGNAGGPGEDNAYAGRIRYDMDNLHLQASYGSSSNAGGSPADQDTEDYTVMDLGAKYTMNPLTVKFEYIAGENVQGIEDLDQNVMYLHGGFMVTDSTELVARHYAGNWDNGNAELDVTNTYFGANFFLNDAMRIQANYVVAGGDNEDYATAVGGGTTSAFGKTYTDDTLLAQFQYSF